MSEQELKELLYRYKTNTANRTGKSVNRKLVFAAH